MKVLFSFILGFCICFFGLTYYLGSLTPEKSEVLSEIVEVSPDHLVSPSPSPTLEPSPSPLPSKTPRLTPKPSPKMSPSNTSSSSPSLSSSSTPSSTPDVVSPVAYEPFFSQYSSQYGVDKNLLEKIADCESHFNPNAVNESFLGMFQFASQTWITNRNLMELDASASLRTNAEESIKTAAFVISKNGSSAWGNCN